MTEETLKQQLAAIPDAELLENCHKFLSGICKGERFSMNVPASSKDFDMQMSELFRRFKDYGETISDFETAVSKAFQIINATFDAEK